VEASPIPLFSSIFACSAHRLQPPPTSTFGHPALCYDSLVVDVFLSAKLTSASSCAASSVSSAADEHLPSCSMYVDSKYFESRIHLQQRITSPRHGMHALRTAQRFQRSASPASPTSDWFVVRKLAHCYVPSCSHADPSGFIVGSNAYQGPLSAFVVGRCGSNCHGE